MQMDDKIAFGNNILEQLAYHHRQGRDLSIPKHIVPCYYSLNNFEQFLKENLIIFHIDKDDFYILSRKKYKRILAENPYKIFTDFEKRVIDRCFQQSMSNIFVASLHKIHCIYHDMNGDVYEVIFLRYVRFIDEKSILIIGNYDMIEDSFYPQSVQKVYQEPEGVSYKRFGLPRL